MKRALICALFVTIARLLNAQTVSVETTAFTATPGSSETLNFFVENGTYMIRKIHIRTTATGMGGAPDINVYIKPQGPFTAAGWSILDATTGTPLVTANQPTYLTSSQTTSSGSVYYVSVPTSGPGVDLYVKFNSTTASNPLLVVDNWGPSPSERVEFVLNGVVSAQQARTFSMVLDRSGSMGQIVVGSTTRTDLLRAASRYFVNLVNTARANPGDQIAIAPYDDNIAPTLSRTAISSGLSNIIDKINSTDLNPGGSTATGMGLEAGNGLLDMMVHANNSIILVTDGEENVFPPDMASANVSSAVDVSTIGLGSAIGSSFQMALESYAGGHNGTYHYVSENTATTSTIPIDLEKAYLAIFAQRENMAEVIDPIYTVALDMDHSVSKVPITSSDANVIFSVFEEPTMREVYKLDIISPTGEVLANGAMPSGIKGTIVRENGFSIFKADFTAATNPASYSGDWQVMLRPIKKQDSSYVTLGLSTIVRSSIALSTGVSASNHLPGSEIVSYFDVKDGEALLQTVGTPLMTVTDPKGQVYSVIPQKDANGKWVGKFGYTATPGTYQVFTRLKFKNLNGEVSLREHTDHVALSTPYVVPKYDCFTCSSRTTIIVVGIVVAVLVILLLFAIWKKK